jgi:hypothetical protein
MAICGKPVRMIGKIASGNFTHCTRVAGHSGACDEKATGETESAPKQKIITDPEEGWFYIGTHPKENDEQSGDSSIPPYVPGIPDGVVIQ